MARVSLFGRWSDYQLSRLEVVFAIIVLLVLLSIFLNRMIIILAQAERALVENSIVNMNSALRVYTAHLQMTAGLQALADLQHVNPVPLLEQKSDRDLSTQVESEQLATMLRARTTAALPNYSGEMTEAEAVGLADGSWYFDPEQLALVYRIRSAEVFRSNLPGPSRIRYRLELDFEDRDGDGKFSPSVDQFNTFSLKPLDDFQWLF